MRQKKQATTVATLPTPVEQLPLSPYRAFVVQFREATPIMQDHFMGRAEHMVSGQAARFSSPEELTAFLQQVLSRVHERNLRDD